jgi:hypothetical protein
MQSRPVRNNAAKVNSSAWLTRRQLTTIAWIRRSGTICLALCRTAAKTIGIAKWHVRQLIAGLPRFVRTRRPLRIADVRPSIRPVTRHAGIEFQNVSEDPLPSICQLAIC